MNIEDLGKAYVEKYNKYEAERKKIEGRIEQRKKQIVRLEKKLSNLSCPSWIDEILRPIAKAMLKHLPDRYFDILGPFEMTCETTIHFYKKGIAKSEEFDGDNCKSLTVRPTNLDEGHLSLVDYKHNSHRFAKGTMGEVNGMNYSTIPMKQSINELVKAMN